MSALPTNTRGGDIIIIIIIIIYVCGYVSREKRKKREKGEKKILKTGYLAECCTVFYQLILYVFIFLRPSSVVSRRTRLPLGCSALVAAT